MAHVLLWLIVLAGPVGPVQVVIVSDPFPTLAACEAWDRVPLTMQATVRIEGSESRCVPADKAPQPAPQRPALRI